MVDDAGKPPADSLPFDHKKRAAAIAPCAVAMILRYNQPHDENVLRKGQHMLRKPIILITGANGEVGHGLIQRLSQQQEAGVVAMDLRPLDANIRPLVYEAIVGDILDAKLFDRLQSEYEIRAIYHLAALLSTYSEFRPENAHNVNVQGTVNLLALAAEQGRITGHAVKFLFPSSIAVYGLPDLEMKNSAPPVSEDQHNQPITMYGCNKLYGEHLGRYYAQHYRQLDPAQTDPHTRNTVDFRSLRFPGLISATTMPTGGTSDYVPEMLHHSAQHKPYACFVRDNTLLPFMAMPDAIEALIRLADAPRSHLTRTVYNVTSFTVSAGTAAERARSAFPDAQISFNPHPQRQRIVDSWAAAMDDSTARRDWGWAPAYDEARTFDDYLVPTIRAHYAKQS
jgi:threonine 3-dehydrogenase